MSEILAPFAKAADVARALRLLASCEPLAEGDRVQARAYLNIVIAHCIIARTTLDERRPAKRKLPDGVISLAEARDAKRP